MTTNTPSQTFSPYLGPYPIESRHEVLLSTNSRFQDSYPTSPVHKSVFSSTSQGSTLLSYGSPLIPNTDRYFSGREGNDPPPQGLLIHNMSRIPQTTIQELDSREWNISELPSASPS